MSRRGRRGPRGGSSLSIDRTRLKALFVVIVGLSGGLIALQGDASPAAIAAATAGGLLVGYALLWYLIRFS